MANQTFTAYNPTSSAVGGVPAKSKADVVIDDATGIAALMTLFNAGCIVMRKDTATRDQFHSRMRSAGLHVPGV
jgi:hypothetical protein